MSAELPQDYFGIMSRRAGIGIMATDEQFIVHFCNPAAEELLGRPTGELVGHHLLGIVPPERTELAQRLLERILQSGESTDFQMRYSRPTGQTIQLAVTVSPIVEGDRSLGMALFLRDVSRQIALLRDVAQAQKMAALESVAGAVAHHFNNILGGAITTADFALASDDPELHKRTLGITVTVLSRANELTHGLLAFAEGEHTDTFLVDVRQTIERYIAGLKPTLDARGIALDVELEPVAAAAPPKGITQILDRLTANAVEAMPSGGTLRLRFQAGQDDEIVLQIADSGPGIPEHLQPRLFEPFFTTKQPERNRSTDHPGLGLAAVYGIVKDLGGTIKVTSSPEDGTCFTVRLPVESLTDRS
jgi:two-component system, cell cycle sensor histidine kinase and response regulator CckA